MQTISHLIPSAEPIFVFKSLFKLLNNSLIDDECFKNDIFNIRNIISLPDKGDIIVWLYENKNLLTPEVINTLIQESNKSELDEIQ
jgi:hypothetical protein